MGVCHLTSVVSFMHRAGHNSIKIEKASLKEIFSPFPFANDSAEFDVNASYECVSDLMCVCLLVKFLSEFAFDELVVSLVAC